MKIVVSSNKPPPKKTPLLSRLAKVRAMRANAVDDVPYVPLPEPTSLRRRVSTKRGREADINVEPSEKNDELPLSAARKEDPEFHALTLRLRDRLDKANRIAKNSDTNMTSHLKPTKEQSNAIAARLERKQVVRDIQDVRANLLALRTSTTALGKWGLDWKAYADRAKKDLEAERVRRSKLEAKLASAEEKAKQSSELKMWPLVRKVLLSEGNKLTNGSSVNLLTCCAANSKSPIMAAFRNGLKECNLELADIVDSEGELNTKDFILAFHGTPSANSVREIIHEGFDPAKRRRQQYGPGEYFGSFSTARKYCGSPGGIFLVLLVRKTAKKASNQNDFIVVDNPPLTSKKTYCLPVAWASFGFLTEAVTCCHTDCVAPRARFFEFVNDKNMWEAVDPSLQDLFSNKLASGNPVFHCDFQGFKYAVDLDQMVQTNLNTRKTRRLRRLK